MMLAIENKIGNFSRRRLDADNRAESGTGVPPVKPRATCACYDEN